MWARGRCGRASPQSPRWKPGGKACTTRKGAVSQSPNPTLVPAPSLCKNYCVFPSMFLRVKSKPATKRWKRRVKKERLSADYGSRGGLGHSRSPKKIVLGSRGRKKPNAQKKKKPPESWWSLEKNKKGAGGPKQGEALVSLWDSRNRPGKKTFHGGSVLE